MSTTEEKRRRLPFRGIILYTVAAASTLLFVAIAMQMLDGRADAFDRRWALAIHDSADHDIVDAIMVGFTTIGSGPCLWGLIVLVSFFAGQRGHWRYGVILAANGVAVLLINTLLKAQFVRQRPELFDEITRPETWSFPSGHAMSAVQIFGALGAVLIALYPRQRPLIVAVALVLIAGIGTSRVYLGVHWPTDVIAGYLSAMPFLAVSVHLVHRLRRTGG